MYWQRNMFRIFSSEESELENITYRTHLCDPLCLCVCPSTLCIVLCFSPPRGIRIPGDFLL